jgi:hypothetical protein
LRLHPFGRNTFVAAATATGCFGVVPLAVVAVLGANPSGALVAVLLGVASYAAALSRIRHVLHLDGIR